MTDDFAKKPLHINGLNVDRLVEPQHGASVTETLQRNVDAVRAARGCRTSTTRTTAGPSRPVDLAAVRALPACSRSTTVIPPSTTSVAATVPGLEAVWDRLLSTGRRVYGIAVDDAHVFKRPVGPRRRNARTRLAGRPRARGSKATAIVTSIEGGDFYACTGVELAAYSADRSAIAVTVKPNSDTRYRIRLIWAGPPSRPSTVRPRASRCRPAAATPAW